MSDVPHAEPVELVNPLCGSDSDDLFSTGLTYPAVTTPWGMTAFSPRNCSSGAVFQRRRSRAVNQLRGITATHAPSRWMGDYGTFTLMPYTGAINDDLIKNGHRYRLDREVSRPDYFACQHVDTGMRVEVTATGRCGVLRVSYPATSIARLLIRLDSPRCTVEWDRSGGVIRGTARGNQGGVAGDFGCRFVIQSETRITGHECLDAERGLWVVELDQDHGRPVVLRIGTSFISHDQAMLNLQRECSGRTFEQVRTETAECWNRELSRIAIEGGTHDQRRTFYTCLWRALLFPRDLHEVDAQGQVVHYSPYTGQVEPGPLMTDNGFWDTSRTVYPLLALAWPHRLGQILDGWLTAYRESGWMPQWASPGHRACMVGTHSAAVFADAIVKGIEGFDHQLAYEAMKRDATVPGDPHGRFGRQQLPEYLEMGYCPEVGGDDSVCRTLDYSYNDWCCAQVAEALGHHDDAATFRERSHNWKHLFDPVTRFFRPKNAQGQWIEPFDEFRWGGPYREGSAWQYRFAVPHDPAGLAGAFGGADQVVQAIQQMVDTPPRFGVGEYGREIHEMTEMAAANFGQYAHSNQPVHGFLWIPAQLGKPDVTDRLVRRVLTEMYSPDSFPGDEDNGEMGAWYVLAAIGRFPHCPGARTLTSTPPLFGNVQIRRDSDSQPKPTTPASACGDGR